MISWWSSLSVASQVFACIAIPTTLVLVIQSVLMLIGLGTDSADVDGPDFDGPDFDGPDFDGLDTHIDGVFEHDISEGDVDPSGLEALRLFTVRGIIAFLVVFGWVGYIMANAGITLYITLPIALICGFVMMTLLALLIRAVMKLRNDGNLDNRNAIGASGRVYLTIPANRQGEGKVNVMLQGSYVERDAVTDESSDIPTGSEVVVFGLSGQTTLVVKRK